MCFKCRTLFAGHRVNACTVPTPVLQVPFRPLDEADASYAENGSSSSSRRAPPVAAVIEDVDSREFSDEEVDYRDENGPVTPPRDGTYAADARHTG
ncbi:hypothetical protein K435DRAFT_733869 [Dendrothele bispora CBS 962.96]|uniref:Uncharacterized protein n=1 Tax=Dendrothele bispora (strain CBS 962.96) TaxID=1314807 RepID=A0A4S8L4W1_DENBC|nr:hypothetical protein K435DRAFT_733869 [Dendrothele bispora CBS 962.96]